jgi:hypothetical protein
MTERMGINRASILRHSFFSSWTVSVGGAGRQDSPPNSILSDLDPELLVAVSICESVAFVSVKESGALTDIGEAWGM